jgi:hypothetical protein
MLQDPATGALYIESPDITYSSRVALAIQAQQNNAFSRTLETLAALLETHPELLDNFELDTIVRDGSRNEGFPADWIKAIKERDAIRQARAEAQAQQQQMQNAMATAQTAADASKAAPAIQMLQDAA